MRKKIITISIIVGSFAIALLLLYFAIYKKTPTTVEVDGVQVPLTEKNTLLPHGKNLDFSKIKQYNGSGRLNPAIKVLPNEIGKDLNSILNK
jgi:hypothetical protein